MFNPLRSALIKVLVVASSLLVNLAYSNEGTNSPAEISQDALEVTLEANGYDSFVTVSITNQADQPITFLAWDTPFEQELLANVFDVDNASKGWPVVETATYIGYEVRRWVQDPSAYLTLAPGASMSRTHDLSTSYAVEKTGRYQVRYEQNLVLETPPSLVEKGAGTGFRVKRLNEQGELFRSLISASATATATVLLQPKPYNSPRFVTPGISNCSVSQNSLIDDVLGRSETAVTELVTQFSTMTPEDFDTSPRYRTWFGSYNEQRHDVFSSTMQKLAASLEFQQLNFDCSCLLADRNSLFGYINREIPWRVNLCPLFFSIPEEEVVTMVHELSHFHEVGSTNDFAYGPGLAQSLAEREPQQAVRNADNYGYFVANNVPELTLIGEFSEPEIPVDLVDQYETLEAGETVIRTIDQEDSALFIISGPTRLELETFSGDADLFVFADSSRENLICVSELETPIDACDFDTRQTLFVVVYGYLDSSYSLSSTGVNATSEIRELMPDQSLNGTLVRGESHDYRVANVNNITLDTLSGDADLYIFDSDRFDTASLVCESFLYTSESSRDFCEVPPGIELFVRVYGFEDSDYTLVARGDGTVVDNPELSVEELGIGEEFTGFLAEAELSVFTATGPGRLDLVSQTGDADLSVYQDMNFANAFCVSAEFSSTSTLDSCEIPVGSFVVVVNGYTQTNFQLSFVEEQNPDQDAEAPNVVDNIISWPDNGWYQVQHGDTFEEVCAGGTQCEVDTGSYVVINHTSGERWDSVQVGGPSGPAGEDGVSGEGISVNSGTISWPNDGWYQVLQDSDFSEVCGGGSSCSVAPGSYILINHTTGERWENVTVSSSTSSPSDGEEITVNGNVISWPDDGWYQVQDSSDFMSICEGGRSCTVAAGTYLVVNHSTGQRWEGITIESSAIGLLERADAFVKIRLNLESGKPK